MLSKLLKYEMKATGRIFLPLFLALLVFAGINKCISVVSPQNWSFPTIISMVIYVIIMVGMFVMTFVVMIQRFYKNLLSDEGYLMFTLPTMPWKHIVSKLLVSMLWILASVIVAIVSILIIAFDKTVFAEIMKQITIIFNQIFVPMGTSAYLLILEFIIGSLISLASSILIIYASVAIGHLFNQHRILASFGAYIALNTLTQIIFTLISLIPGIAYFSHIQAASNDLAAMQGVIHLVLGYGIVFAGLLCAAYFAITNIILSRRLNLE